MDIGKRCQTTIKSKFASSNPIFLFFFLPLLEFVVFEEYFLKPNSLFSPLSLGCFPYYV